MLVVSRARRLSTTVWLLQALLLIPNTLHMHAEAAMRVMVLLHLLAPMPVQEVF
jgi:hypothetical protein